MDILFWVFVYVWLQVPLESRTGYWITGAEVTDCEPFDVTWELTSDPLQEKYVLHSEPLSHLSNPQNVNFCSRAK